MLAYRCLVDGRHKGDGSRDGYVTTMARIFLHLLRVSIHRRDERILEAKPWLLFNPYFFIAPALEAFHDGPGVKLTGWEAQL